MPSRPRSAICGRMAGSNWCARSRSWMRGATSARAHSRTRLLEQLLLFGQIQIDHGKRRILARWKGSGYRRTTTDAPRRNLEALGGAAAVHGDLEMLAAAEQRADAGRAPRPSTSQRAVRRDVRRQRSRHACPRQMLEAAAIDVRDEIAEPIDPQHDRPRCCPSRDVRIWNVEHAARSSVERPRRRDPTPFASQAAAGANRSRPSNVRLIVGRAYCRFVSSTTRLGGVSLNTIVSRPLSGRHESISRRLRRQIRDASVPTPGSTTQRNIVPVRKDTCTLRQARARRQHVVRGNVVGDVDERRVRTDSRAPRPASRRRSDRGAEVSQQRDDGQRLGPRSRGWRGGRLAEQHFAQVVLQQELLGDAQRLEQPLDVAVGQRPLLAAGRVIRAVLQRLAVDHHVSRVRRRRLVAAVPPC